MPLQISDRVRSLAHEAQNALGEQFSRIDGIAEENTQKVLSAFQKHRVAEGYFAGTTGYGYDDLGRDKLDAIYADVFGTEDALVRIQFVNGTHAIACALFGALRGGDVLVSAVGAPYDTLLGVIGVSDKGPGSLKDYGVEYRQVELLDNKPDIKEIAEASADRRVKAVLIQRSRGYATRASLSVEEIGEICAAIRGANPRAAILVDNCYGEFVETTEPSEVGADMVVGSLIKNPGGGLAPIGGYIAGKRECVENAACRLTSPGLAKEVGASLGILPAFYQGLFLAPTVTASALKGAIFAANIYEKLGFAVVPDGTESRHDIIQAVTFGTPEGVCAFCEGIQAAAPVDSFVKPEPWDMPGYDSKVIMAAGAFVSGSSIELSADGPIAPPYAVYFQGGLTFPHAKLGILKSLQNLVDRGICSIC